MTLQAPRTKQRGRPPLSANDIAEKRAAIAAAARALFVEQGYGAVSIRRVADAVGVTPTTLYAYFDSKFELLRYLWSDVFDDLFDRLDTIARRERDPMKRLLKVSMAYVRYWTDHPDHYRMVFMSEGVSQPEVSVFITDDNVATRFDLFARCLSAAGLFDSRSLVTTTQLWLCTLHGIAHLHVTASGYAWQPPATLIKTMFNAFFPNEKQ